MKHNTSFFQFFKLFSIITCLLSCSNLKAEIEVLDVTNATNGSCNGEIFLILDGTAGPFNTELYLIATPQNVFQEGFDEQLGIVQYDNLCAGDYLINVENYFGCLTELNVTILETCQDCYPIDANVGEGSIHVLIECQETGGFTYEWSDGATDNPRTGLATGTYCVTATSNDGCVQTGCWDVDTECNSDPVTDSNVDVTHSCLAAPMSGALEVINPQQNLYYFWSGPSNYNAEGAIISNLFPGEYCLSITGDVFGSPCPMAAGCFTIESDGDQCCDDCYPISAMIDQGNIFVDVECMETLGFTYEWSDGETGNPRKNLDPGTYCVTITSMSGNCTMSGCWEITEGCLPIQQLIDQNANISCSSQDNGSIEITFQQFNSNAFPVWTDSDGYYVGYGYELTNMPPGEYCVEIMETVFGGCILAEGCFTIDATDLRVGIDYITRPLECDGFCASNIALSVSSSSSNLTYEWTGPDGFTASWQNIINVCVGDYVVTVTDEDTGCSVVVEADVCCCTWDGNSQGNAPDDYCFFPNWNLPSLEITAVITPIDSDIGTTEGAIDISTNVPNTPDNNSPNNYTWAGPDGYTSFDQDISNLEEGEYCVTVDNGCASGSQCFIIIDCAEAVWGITEDVTPSCPGADAGIIEISNVSITNDSEVLETGPYVFMMDGQDDIEGDMATFEGLRKENTYVVTIFDEKTGCSEDFSFDIDEAPPNINIDENIDDTCPGYEYGTITLNAFGDFEPYTYNWSQGGNGTAAYNLGADDYTVTVRDSRGCSAVFGSLTVGNTNQVIPEDVVDDCTHRFYCNGSELSDLTVYDFDISEYDPNDCRYYYYLCEDSNGDTYNYFPNENTDGYEYFELEEEDIQYNVSTTECFAQYYCQNGDPYDNPIQGYYDPVEFHDYDSGEGCYYCFTATYCVLDMGGAIGEVREAVSIDPHIASIEITDTGCTGDACCNYDSANPDVDNSLNCEVEIRCSLLPPGSNVMATVCDINCNDTDYPYLCDASYLWEIAGENFDNSGDQRVDISERHMDLFAKVYPNPFTDDFYIEINSKYNQNLDFAIFNILGQLVDKSSFLVSNDINTIKIEGSKLQESGVYYLVLTGKGDVSPITIPIVKQ